MWRHARQFPLTSRNGPNWLHRYDTWRIDDERRNQPEYLSSWDWSLLRKIWCPMYFSFYWRTDFHRQVTNEDGLLGRGLPTVSTDRGDTLNSWCVLLSRCYRNTAVQKYKEIKRQKDYTVPVHSQPLLKKILTTYVDGPAVKPSCETAKLANEDQLSDWRCFLVGLAVQLFPQQGKTSSNHLMHLPLQQAMSASCRSRCT